MTVVLVICGAVLTVAAVLLLVRIASGPTMLDRVIALDVLVAVLIAAMAAEAAANRHTTTIPILVALALAGFVGSVSIARFAAPTTDQEAEEGGEQA